MRSPNFKIVCHETFGPLLYLMTYRDFDEAIAIQNGVPAGSDVIDFHRTMCAKQRSS